LDKNVKFEIMGCDDGLVDVGIVFMLAINSPNGHIKVLQKLMNIFQKKEVLMDIENSDNVSNILKILSKELN